jgi:hypothetical protein
VRLNLIGASTGWWSPSIGVLKAASTVVLKAASTVVLKAASKRARVWLNVIGECFETGAEGVGHRMPLPHL